MKKKVLITGLVGFAGSHLAELCLKKGEKVYGSYRYHFDGREFENIEHIKGKINLIPCDLNNYDEVWKLLNEVKPDVIYHLAAQSFVQESFSAPMSTMHTNIFQALNIFEVVKSLKIKPTILLACTSEEYGFVEPHECPITEENDLRPLSPYAVSKVSMDMLAQQYYRTYGVKTIITRAFNHEGPRRGRMFVISSFAEQIVRIEKGLQEPNIHVGNLTAERDFTDVRDMVNAYHLAIDKCDYGTPYNIGTGTAIRMDDMLQKLIAQTTYDGEIGIVQDKDRIRPSDVPLLMANANKFIEKTKWKPVYTFDQTLADTLNYWRYMYEVR